MGAEARMLMRKAPEVGDARLDGLIRRALWEWVADAEPPPAVWERIWRRARARGVPRRRNTLLNWSVATARLRGVDASFPMRRVACNGLVASRCDPIVAQSLDC